MSFLSATEANVRGYALSKWRWDALPRGLALFLGGFTLINILGTFRAAGFDVNLWWLDLRPLHPALINVLLLGSGLCLTGFAARPPRVGWRAVGTLICLGALILVSLLDAGRFFVLLARGAVHTGVPVPLSLLIAGALSWILATVWRGLACSSSSQREAEGRPGSGLGMKLALGRSNRTRSDFTAVLVVFMGSVLLFPLAQMVFFGKTDYRRPADAVVVLGARVYADGRLSDALADRVRTACRLYQAGLVHKFICSGGPGDGAISEPEAMRRMAIQLGVKPGDIVLDNAGLNTQATVRNTCRLLEQWQAQRVLVVSHFYHLPRIKLAYQRAGWNVYTVPAKESYLLRQLPYNMAREVAALWAYYWRPLAG